MITLNKGLWKSKTSELLAELVDVKGTTVWYTIPACIGPQPCTVETWVSSMTFVGE